VDARRRPAAVVGAALLLTLAACSSGGGATPTATVTVTRSSGTSSASPAPEPTATSDVQGRRFDLGTVTEVSTVAGTLVVELDRWTLPGTSDTAIARRGIKVVPHEGARYTNQNDQKTYTAPVAAGAIAVVNRCVPGPAGQLGLESTPEDAAGWLKDADGKDVLVVTYDEDGAITRLDTDPRC
jgi:hypothetical protein